MKIKVTDTDRLVKALVKAEYGCRVRTLTHTIIQDKVNRQLEPFFSQLFFPKHMTGIRVAIQSTYQKPARVNGNDPRSTQVTVERGVSDWYVVDIARVNSWTSPHHPAIAWRWVNAPEYTDILTEAMERKTFGGE